jgi:pseudouridylate synthase
MPQRHDDLLAVAPEVRDALAGGRPVVALESTIVTHGMPYPQNLETARVVEDIVRAEGAVPATIALFGGRVRIGLDAAELERLGAAQDVAKASRRDLAALLARKTAAGTTVAATMIAAARARIPIFATGGIGGVHRGAGETWDVSADLVELSRTPVAVVCAGAKSILDIAKTLEVLETHGVPVLGYRTDDFPAFFARTSGHKVDHRFESPRELAEVISVQRRLGLDTGLLIANPVPEAEALPTAAVEAQIEEACRDAEAAGVSGKELTPFLLARINEVSGGQSLRANIALIKSNATLAAEIAVELARLGPA